MNLGYDERLNGVTKDYEHTYLILMIYHPILLLEPSARRKALVAGGVVFRF